MSRYSTLLDVVAAPTDFLVGDSDEHLLADKQKKPRLRKSERMSMHISSISLDEVFNVNVGQHLGRGNRCV